jgi:integrase
MARSTRAPSLETRTARLKLTVRKKPYSVRISPSLRLGYRRNQTAGVWSLIVADGKGGSWLKKFAIADDFEESDGRSVLDFWQAQKQARLLARGGQDDESDYGKPATVAEALESYEKDLAARGGMTSYPKRLRKVLPPAFLTKPVALLTAKELSALRDDFGKELKPASVNRQATALMAALNHAASLDERITNSKAWKIGLKPIPDAHRARNVILDDATVRKIVAEAYQRSEAFGLLIETLATTGARVSQAARLDVADLQGDRLMMPSSAKGRAAKRYNRVPLPIPPGLAVRLKRAAEGRPEDAPLLVRPGYDRWISTALRQPFDVAAKAACCDPKVVTPNCLRHSSIVRQLINSVPIRVTAAHHDTSIRMIERTYSKHISDHSEALVRRALLDAVVLTDNLGPGVAA